MDLQDDNLYFKKKEKKKKHKKGNKHCCVQKKQWHTRVLLLPRKEKLVRISQNVNITHVHLLHFWMSCLLENGIYNLEQSSKNISSKLKVHVSYIPTICFNSQGCFIFHKLLCKTLFLVLIPFSPALVRTFTHQSWPLSSLSSLCHLVSSDMLKFPAGNTYLVVSTTSPTQQMPFCKNCLFLYPWY